MPLLTESRMHRLVAETLVAGGLTEAEAKSCADASVFADLRGTTTHGITYIVRRTLESIRMGNTVSGSEPEIVRSAGASSLIRGAGVVGPLMGETAMARACSMAAEQGVGFVNVLGGNPIGLLGYYANLAAERGMVGLVMANTAPSAAPHGATSAVLGTNPFAFAAPGDEEKAMIFDIASTVASAGKITRAKRTGEAMPEDWMIDAEGKPITDPARADEGVMQPFGGHKGAGIALLVHLLTGGLAGTTVGGDATHTNPDPEKRGQGAVYMAVDPAMFGGREVFAAMTDRQIDFIHAASPLPGAARPLYPGERGWTELARRKADGIDVPDSDWKVVLKAMRDSDLSEQELAGDIG